MALTASMRIGRAIALALALAPAAAGAQWVTTHEQFYAQAPHNWQFRKAYPAADRLFNAFDYGHAILYETLWRTPDAPASRLEQREYDFITTRLLAHPPHVPVEEGAIEVAYAKLAPEAKAMFEWAHVLHRQIYDVLADERLGDAQKDAEVARLVAYYKTRRDLAFSSHPKSMELMEGQPYSLAFRRGYPKFNGLIWSYHWLQVGLYDALLAGHTRTEREANVNAAVARFWSMLEDAPVRMPRVMPMTAAVAPAFTRRFTEAAIIFDNLHGMHDVISDILANPKVPRDRKRAEILLAARRYRDDTSYVTTVAAWRDMAGMMGLETMGGPPVGLLPRLPSAPAGMQMDHGAMGGAPMKKPMAAPAPHDSMPMPMPMAMPHEHEVRPTSDSAGAIAAVRRFHEALAAGDSATALTLLAPDLVVLEGGEMERLPDYRAHHLAADIEYARAVRTDRTLVSAVVRDGSAWVSSTTRTHGRMGGRTIDSQGAELIVLARTDAGWKVSAIHWSSKRR